MSAHTYRDTCRRCGVEPREWEELQDGLCPFCRFDDEVLGDD
jgi:hypothetical protein